MQDGVAPQGQEHRADGAGHEDRQDLVPAIEVGADPYVGEVGRDPELTAAVEPNDVALVDPDGAVPPTRLDPQLLAAELVVIEVAVVAEVEVGDDLTLRLLAGVGRGTADDVDVPRRGRGHRQVEFDLGTQAETTQVEHRRGVAHAAPVPTMANAPMSETSSSG